MHCVRVPYADLDLVSGHEIHIMLSNASGTEYIKATKTDSGNVIDQLSLTLYMVYLTAGCLVILLFGEYIQYTYTK